MGDTILKKKRQNHEPPTDLALEDAKALLPPEPQTTEPPPKEPSSERLRAFTADDYQTPTVTLRYPCKAPETDTRGAVEATLNIPMRTRGDLDRIISLLSSEAPGLTEEMKLWTRAFETSMEFYVKGQSLEASLSREQGDWSQAVAGDKGESLKMLAVSPKTHQLSGVNLSGEHALSVLNKKLKLGCNITVPLWHSGFWITLKAPTSSQLIAVDRLLSDEKIILGRQTNGLIYSNVSVYLRRTLVDLALACIYDASIENFSREALLDLIRVTDYNIIMLALGSAMYPNGYPLAQPCSDNPTACTHVTHERVALPKLNWVDRSQLTPWQVTFMSDMGSIKKTTGDIKRYQSEGAWNATHRIALTDDVAIINKVPTLREDLQGGVRWVESVVASVRELYDETVLADEETLNLRIAEQSRAAALRQYDSWIEAYVITEEEDTEPYLINDRETIERTCETLVAEPDIVHQAFEGIGQFIDRSTINLVGIPNYPCPVCQKHLADPEQHPKIIPLSVDELFFTLMRQTTTRVVRKLFTF